MTIIGRSETVALPELGVQEISARIDTGAATSSLHCHKISKKRDDEGTYLEYFVLDPAHPSYSQKRQVSRIFKIKTVKSSNGISQKRFAVKIKMKLGGKIYRIECTLADRSEMKHPMLIGRQFLSKKFLVDVSKSNLLSNQQ